MLVSELKKEIENYNKKDLEKIIVELYKRIPKNKKEDYDIDDFIKKVSSINKTIKKEVSFEELKKEIIYFIQCVDNELYVIPNKIISKKERSSWRFKVKRYYKELNNILPLSDNGEIATMLLIEIFKRLSIGSNRLLFINWETFKALGVSQSDYYDMIINRIMATGYIEENIKKSIDLLDVPKDPYELSYDMFETFISNLKTVDNRNIAIKLINEKIKELKNKIINTKDNHVKFYIQRDINEYVICIVNIYFVLDEIKLAINYFHNNYIESDKEVKEYILLKELDNLNLSNYWIMEYESKKDSIDFRNYLKNRYKELKENENN